MGRAISPNHHYISTMDKKSQTDTKRKTHTSTEVKRRYNAKTYTQIIVSVKKETAEAYKSKCISEGISFSKILHEAIDEYLSK